MAHILVKTVDAFYGMNPREVIPLIENCCVSAVHKSQPFIGVVPVEPGLTNAMY